MAFATWNPTDQSNITLSNGDLTATSTSGTSPVGIRGTIGLNTGKYYFEVTRTDWSGTSSGQGLATTSAVLFPTQTGLAIVTRSLGGTNGSIYINGVFSGSSLGPRANGDVIGIAVDLTARLIWFKSVSPAGNWNGSGAANPTTGTGGLSISALTGSLYPTFVAASTGQIATSNFGSTAFIGTVPSGFTSGWSNTVIPASASTWNPIDKNNTTLSNGNLTATNSVATSGVRGTVGKLEGGGKWYFEITGTGANIGMGIARSSADLNAINPMGASVVRTSDGAIFSNTGYVGTSIGNVNGVRVDVAIDLNAGLIWFRNSSTGIWNGLSGSNPATGALGADCSVIMFTEAVYPYGGTEVSTGQVINLNCGSSAFIGTVPTGFASGWGVPSSSTLKRPGLYASDGSMYVTFTDGKGVLDPVLTSNTGLPKTPPTKLRAKDGSLFITATTGTGYLT